MKKLALLVTVVAAASCNSSGSKAEPLDAGAPAVAPAPAPPPADPLEEAGLQRLSLTIDGALELSMRNAVDSDVAAPLSQVTARLLVWWVDVRRDLRKGDKLDVIYDLPPGEEPLIHALRFYSNKNERDYRAYLFQPEGARWPRYFQPTAEELEERLEHGPIDEYQQVTSVLRDGRKHRGVDFKTPVGSPVKMPFDAHLTRKNWRFRGNGNCLEFRDSKSRRIIFLHLDELPKDLAVGKTYRAGQLVARSGNTGHSTAPHLHYQLENAAGKVLDPYEVHQTYRARLEASQVPAFEATRARYDRMLEPDKAPAPTPVASVPAAEPVPAPQAAAAP
ncbi:MAG TPA: peptidase M23 [Myxococcales bacterium]|nr:peptidase M23 [Myxococcales bacterium]